MGLMMNVRLNYIDGKWVPALSGKTRETINPADKSVVAVMAEGGVKDVELAVAAAKRAFTKPGMAARKRTLSQRHAYENCFRDAGAPR